MEITVLITDNLCFADALAQNYKKKLPCHVSIEDLKAAAYMGLVEAANSFQLKYGVAFTSFAFRRIRGAMIDWITEMYGLRTESLDRQNEDGSCLAETLESERIEPITNCWELLEQGISHNDRKILRYYFEDGHTMKEVGEHFSLTEARVSQIIKGCRKLMEKNWNSIDSDLAA